MAKYNDGTPCALGISLKCLKEHHYRSDDEPLPHNWIRTCDGEGRLIHVCGVCVQTLVQKCLDMKGHD